MRKLIANLCLLLAILFTTYQTVWAWGNTGHEAIAYVAWQQMTPQAKAQVLELLKLVPAIHTQSGDIPGYDQWVSDLPAGISSDQKNLFLFMRGATWADSIKHHGLSDSDTPPISPQTVAQPGFNDTHSYGYWHFIDTPFATDNETMPTTPAPNVVSEISALRIALVSDESATLKAYDLVWLEHLVGDIHQPLHAVARFNAGTSDRGGNMVRIDVPTALKPLFRCGSASARPPTELHAFWDDLPGSCPAETAFATASTFGQVAIAALSAATTPEATAMANDSAEVWAQESLADAEETVYSTPIGIGVKPQSGGASFVITQTYYDRSLMVAKLRVALAGARLAKLLNDSFR